MTDQQKIIAVVCAAAVFWYALRSDGRRRDEEVPTPPKDAPNFVEVFDDNPDREAASLHAHRLGDMCWEIAGKIEYDAKKGRTSRFRSDSNIQDFRVQVRDYLEEGGSYGALYPQLGPAMQGFFESRVGNEESELTDKRRGDWVSAFRGVSAALLHASQEL